MTGRISQTDRVTAFRCEGPLGENKPCPVVILVPTDVDFFWRCPLHRGDANIECLGDITLPRALRRSSICSTTEGGEK